MNIKWDAKKYAEEYSFVHQNGNELLKLISHKRGLSVLDLGCGDGVLTALLSGEGMDAEGMDDSDEMLIAAREHYPDLKFIKGNAVSFRLRPRVDVIFSNAVFHWIEAASQPAMLHCIYDALNPGGQLVFEFGGRGNNALIHEALEKAFTDYDYSYRMPFYFPTTREYSGLLSAAGFETQYAVLFDRMTELRGDVGLPDWIRMFLKKPFEGIPEKVRDAIIEEAAGNLRSELFFGGKWHADYVRIRGKAIRQPSFT